MRDLETVCVKVTHDLEEAYQRQSAQYNKHHRAQTYDVRDLVLRRQLILSSAAHNQEAKLIKRFDGPFRVRKVLSSGVYEVEDPKSRKIHDVAIKDLRSYFPPLDTGTELNSGYGARRKRSVA